MPETAFLFDINQYRRLCVEIHGMKVIDIYTNVSK